MRRRALCAASGGEVSAPVGVSIATESKGFIPYASWYEQDTPVGVAVSNGEVTVILSLKTSSVKWASSTGDVAGVPTFTSTTALKNYMDGQAYTKALADSFTATNLAAPVAMKETITISGKVFNGYVGSTGEWYLVAGYASDVMAAYQALGYSFVSSATNYWTSCERAAGSTWICAWATNGTVEWTALSKTNARALRTFFRYE